MFVALLLRPKYRFASVFKPALAFVIVNVRQVSLQRLHHRVDALSSS